MSKKVQRLPGDYASLPAEVKERVRSARYLEYSEQAGGPGKVVIAEKERLELS